MASSNKTRLIRKKRGDPQLLADGAPMRTAFRHLAQSLSSASLTPREEFRVSLRQQLITEASRLAANRPPPKRDKPRRRGNGVRLAAFGIGLSAAGGGIAFAADHINSPNPPPHTATARVVTPKAGSARTGPPHIPAPTSAGLPAAGTPLPGAVTASSPPPSGKPSPKPAAKPPAGVRTSTPLPATVAGAQTRLQGASGAVASPAHPQAAASTLSDVTSGVGGTTVMPNLAPPSPVSGGAAGTPYPVAPLPLATPLTAPLPLPASPAVPQAPAAGGPGAITGILHSIWQGITGVTAP